MDGSVAFVTTRVAKSILGVSPGTLRVWADPGRIGSVRSPGGKRLYDVRSDITCHAGGAQAPETAHAGMQRLCYCSCLSSVGQRDDLERQEVCGVNRLGS